MSHAESNFVASDYVPFAQRLMPAPIGGGLAMDDYWVWCGSAISGEDGRYHLFSARWPQRMKFLPGYQSYSEIVRASSDTPEGPYVFDEVVLGDRGPSYWDGRMTHNPVVLNWGGTYLLFYIGTTFEGEKPSAEQLRTGPDFYPWYRGIRIGLATSDSVRGPWVRRDRPFLLPQPGGWDDHVVTNPSPCVAPDGRLLLYYRSWIKGVGNRLGLAVFEGLDGPCTWRSDRPLFDSPGMNIEDPCVYPIDGHLEMVAKDISGSLAGEPGAGAHLLSRDGIHWEAASPAKAYSRDVLWGDGTMRRLNCLERPQVLVQDGVPTHLFAAMADGPAGSPGGFEGLTRTWTGVVPLSRRAAAARR